MRPSELDIAEARRRIAAGTLGPLAVVEDCARRIAEREATIGAFTSYDEGKALAAARASGPGLLHAIPVGIKDIIETADHPTGYGSPIYGGTAPRGDAAAVALLRRAGAVVMGKTVTTEFAYFSPGKTRNPRNPAHTPGGSSSGSAAAVADGMLPAALGTQTAGSIIRPASYCGVVGYKPSFGSFSLAGIKSFSHSLDTLGTLTRTVADAALLRAALLASGDGALAPATGALRIGLCRTPSWDAAEPATRAALETAAQRLAAGGMSVAQLELPAPFARMVEAQQTIMCFEGARNLAFEAERHWDLLSEPLRLLIEKGRATAPADYVAAQRAAAECRRLLADIFGGVDAILCPSAPGEAPAGTGRTGDPLFSRMWTLLHVPQLTIPGLVGPGGLPVGVQLVGPMWEDDRLLAIAARAETLLRG